MIPSLNDLRLLEPERLILHEAHDEDRLVRLRARIREEAEQRNPVIVSPYGDHFLVLDGAHRVRALEELDHLLVLTQIVDPPEKAEGWGHLLENIGPADLKAIEGTEVSGRPDGDPIAEIETADGSRLFLRARERGLLARVRALRSLQSLYPKNAVVRRVEPDGAVALASEEVLIRYGSFTPDELVEIVNSGAVLPAGVTRFRVRERVIGVRYPLDRMKSGDPTARNAELKQFVARRWAENRVRYYREPVVLFE